MKHTKQEIIAQAVEYSLKKYKETYRLLAAYDAGDKEAIEIVERSRSKKSVGSLPNLPKA